MVYRDPDTGQYVSGDGDMPAEYRDYEFQHVHNRYTVPASDLPEAFPITASDVTTVDFDDVLHRDERADIVSVQVHTLQASIPGTSSGESALQCAYELTLGAGDEMITEEDRMVTSDVDGTVLNRNTWESDNPDELFFASWVAEGSFGDSANGLGAGPDAPVITEDVHYPRDYGACPGVDQRDEVTESLYLNQQGGADISDSLIVVDVSYTIVFQVTEY